MEIVDEHSERGRLNEGQCEDAGGGPSGEFAKGVDGLDRRQWRKLFSALEDRCLSK